MSIRTITRNLIMLRIMTIVELNGFDESGNIGENLRFTRVAMDVHDELRPFIYNLLHFGSLTVSKKMVRGQSPENRKAYVRAIFDDPSIQVNHYAYPPTHQLDLLKFSQFLNSLASDS